MNKYELVAELKKIVDNHSEFTTWTVSTPHLLMLVNKAVETEREACAKVCEAWVKDHAKADNCTYADCDFVAAAIDCATAIRARGNT